MSKYSITPDTPASDSPTSSHPLSIEQPSTSRRGRAREPATTEQRPSTSYFTLKAQAGPDKNSAGNSRDRSSGRSTVSGDEYSRSRLAGRSLHSLWDGQSSSPKPPPAATSTTIRAAVRESNAKDGSGDFGPVTSSQVLSTKWHELPDDQIQRTVARYCSTRVSSDSSVKPYITTLRAMSRGLQGVIQERDSLAQRVQEMRSIIENLINGASESEMTIGQRILDVLADGGDNISQEKPSNVS